MTRKSQAKKNLGAKRKKRTRRTRLFPSASFEESLAIPNAIQKHAAGQKVRRITLFGQIGKSPESGPSKQMVTNASSYGLIKGSYVAEFLELTPEGKSATGTDTAPQDKLSSQFKLAIAGISPFKALYDSQKGNRLPAVSVLEDLARDGDVPDKDVKECVEIFTVNSKFLGILKVIAGAERIISIEQALEELPSATSVRQAKETSPAEGIEEIPESGKLVQKDQDWDTTCFYISPIGEVDSEQRNHADLFLGSIVEPALEEFDLEVIRADKIAKPGMITKQVIEYILHSKLVVADLSFHNPNVFYELSLRHACRFPTVQIIRMGDPIPFDLDKFRTIKIDTTSIYSLVPNLQSYKAEIATQVRAALKDPDSVDNPLSTYYPKLKVTF